MIKMKSNRPMLFNGQIVTEFATNEFHARELEALGSARRVDANQSEDPANPEVVVAQVVSPLIAPNDRDNFEREPLRGAKLRTKGQ